MKNFDTGIRVNVRHPDESYIIRGADDSGDVISFENKATGSSLVYSEVILKRPS